jgi:transcriptional regulator with XRE-family HTH domain
MDQETSVLNSIPFGAKVRALRKKRGITQVKLAERLKVTQRVISYYENEHENPSLDLIGKIARALGVSQRQLLDFEEIPPQEEPTPIRSLQKMLSALPALPVEDQKYISKTIDMLVEKQKAEINHTGELHHASKRTR